MNNLLIFIDGCQTGTKNPPEAKYRWPFVYADGIFEIDYSFDIPLFNQEMPTEEGYYIAYTDKSNPVIINLVANKSGIMQGRCCYVFDLESLRHINSPQDWS